MSTEYENLAGTELTAYEHSSKIDLYVFESIQGTDEVLEHYIARDIDAAQLCRLAEELIKIASYISEDPQNTLETYNVDYNKSKAGGIK